MTAKLRFGWVAVLVVLFAFSAARPAASELRIDITRGTVKPMPIAVTDFKGVTEEVSRYGKDISGVVAADLERSGLFKAVDKRAYIQKDLTLNTLPRFGDWRVINAQALVQGRTSMVSDGRLKIEFRLWDVYAEQQMVGLAYFTISENWRRVGHIIADSIYKRITGEEGYFDTRIVYVAESGPLNRREKRLAIMDQDGENHRFLTPADGKLV
ncbi:MAG TPA: Tol-Pal system protein TolB, partial [Rhodospirillales bacterium]|nr:Tol-Pal system protein TolB [Rhodospirillales bacterium]